MTVLYVDDDSDDREIFGAAIHAINPGVTYREFDAGEKILEFLGHEEKKPDHIFIDINMPKMNGYECAMEMVTAYEVECSRIVMYSTSFNATDAQRFHNMGVHMLQKAGNFDQLVQNLRKLLSINPASQVATLQEG